MISLLLYLMVAMSSKKQRKEKQTTTTNQPNNSKAFNSIASPVVYPVPACSHLKTCKWLLQERDSEAFMVVLKRDFIITLTGSREKQLRKLLFQGVCEQYSNRKNVIMPQQMQKEKFQNHHTADSNWRVLNRIWPELACTFSTLHSEKYSFKMCKAGETISVISKGTVKIKVYGARKMMFIQPWDFKIQS